MIGRRRIVGVLIAVALGVPITGARADATTRCSFGGPAGTSRVLRLDLPTGSDFLTMSLTATRTTRPTGTTDSWHLAAGAFVIDEATQQIVSFRISNDGTATRRTVVENDGDRVVDQAAPGPDAPFRHEALAPVPGLAPGSYLVAAFGTDGSANIPNDPWGGFVEVSGTHTCALLPAGTIVDVNQNDFHGGTQISTTGAAYVQGAALARSLSGDLVVGLMDASAEATGDATLDYAMPGGAGRVRDSIEPFAAAGGDYSFVARTSGVAPIISIAALQIALS
jgi:hypothetical protein